MLLKAKGSYRLGFAAIRSGGVSNHSFQRTHEKKPICQSKPEAVGCLKKVFRVTAEKMSTYSLAHKREVPVETTASLSISELLK